MHDRLGPELERELRDRLRDHGPRERGDERVLVLVEGVRLQRARRAIVHRAFHAFLHLRDQRSDVQEPLHLGLEARNLVRCLRVLEVIERAAIRNGRNQRA